MAERSLEVSPRFDNLDYIDFTIQLLSCQLHCFLFSTERTALICKKFWQNSTDAVTQIRKVSFFKFVMLTCKCLILNNFVSWPLKPKKPRDHKIVEIVVVPNGRHKSKGQNEETVEATYVGKGLKPGVHLAFVAHLVKVPFKCDAYPSVVPHLIRHHIFLAQLK
jgi:hypothetical protein